MSGQEQDHAFRIYRRFQSASRSTMSLRPWRNLDLEEGGSVIGLALMILFFAFEPALWWNEWLIGLWTSPFPLGGPSTHAPPRLAPESVSLLEDTCRPNFTLFPAKTPFCRCEFAIARTSHPSCMENAAEENTDTDGGPSRHNVSHRSLAQKPSVLQISPSRCLGCFWRLGFSGIADLCPTQPDWRSQRPRTQNIQDNLRDHPPPLGALGRLDLTRERENFIPGLRNVGSTASPCPARPFPPSLTRLFAGILLIGGLIPSNRSVVIGDSYRERTRASRFQAWTNLRETLRFHWEGSPWFRQWLRPRALNHSFLDGKKDLETASFYRLKTLGLPLEQDS